MTRKSNILVASLLFGLVGVVYYQWQNSSPDVEALIRQRPPGAGETIRQIPAATTISQEPAEASSWPRQQMDSLQEASSRQYGAYTKSVIEQSSVEQNGSDNHARVTQGSLAQAYVAQYDEARILQNGNGLTASINQLGFGTLGNTAFIQQGGIGHAASISQSGGGGNMARIVQH